jgi:cobalt-zinc-cadmium efflux system membrane fusion protein
MNLLYTLMLALVLGTGSYTITNAEGLSDAYASGDHNGHDDHDEDEHENHDEGGDDHGHEDEHDEHGEEEDEHGHGQHDEHEEGVTEIDAAAAKASGIVTAVARSAEINEVLTLTGRVMLNRNTTAEVRARFQGVVTNVNVNWGDKVKKGQPLVTIEANESLKNYTITSPMDGVILARNTNTGNVTGDEPLFTIADLSEVWAEFHVFPSDLKEVKEGQKIRVHTLGDQEAETATLTSIFPTADPLSQTVVVIVPLENRDGKWRPGMTLEGDVYISKKEVGVAVEKSAIQRMGDETVVFVKEGDAYEKRAVELGVSDGEYTEVISGLSFGELYVSLGSFIVKADIGKAAAKHDH